MDLLNIKRYFPGLFTKKKENNPHKRFPDDYYERLWYNKPMIKGAEVVAAITGSSKKTAR